MPFRPCGKRPKLSSRSPEVDAYLSHGAIKGSYAGDASIPFVPIVGAHESQRLPKHDLRRQIHQSAVGTYINRGRILQRSFSLSALKTNDKRQDEEKSLATSAF